MINGEDILIYDEYSPTVSTITVPEANRPVLYNIEFSVIACMYVSATELTNQKQQLEKMSIILHH